MKRALVSCAAIALVGTAACSSSNPTVPPGLEPVDSGPSERVATIPPDTRPLPQEVGPDDAKPKDATDAPLGSDTPFLFIDAGGMPPTVSVTIQSPVAGGSADGGAGDGGGTGGIVIPSTARLAPNVRVTVTSNGGDPTADVIATVSASLAAVSTTGTAASVSLNQTEYQIVPESNTKVYIFGDTPLDLGKVKGGFYTLTVTATTAGGATGAASTSLYLDVGPSITFLQPADGAYVKGSVNVTAIVLDDQAGLTSVQFSVGQVQIPASAIDSNFAQYSTTLDFGSFNPPLDGPQVVTVTATNGNGVVSVGTRQFTVDNQGPVISATKPASGDLIGKLITIEAQVTDPAGVMESSVIAVVAHGDVHFQVNLEKGKDGIFRQLFDTTQLPIYAIFPSISFRAQDVLGNQSSVGYLVSLDNTPPIMDLDPPDHVRLIAKDGTCSWPFDPVGPDAIDDGSIVTQLFDIRARIEDDGNTPLTGTADFVPIAAVDPATVKVLILDDTSLPLVVDTSDPPDGICDDINPDLIPSVSPQSSKDAQLVDMVPMSAGAGAGDFSYQPGVSCSGQSDPPPALCDTTYSPDKGEVMTYSMGYAGHLPSIWTVPPIVGDGLQCAGRQFDASNNLHDGWACVAIEAADKLGNKQVSRPIRICVAAQPGSTACTAASSGGSDLASVTMPSSSTGSVVFTTKAALTGPGGAAVANGDVVVLSGLKQRGLAGLNGDHTVTTVAGGGTQFTLSDVRVALYELWLDPLDGSQPMFKGDVGVRVNDGANTQVITDQPNTPLDPTYAGAAVLVTRGSKLSDTSTRWRVTNIQPTSFDLVGSVTSLAGFVTPAAKLPNCTGTVVKGAAGAAATVDGTKPCKPWAAFPATEYIFL